MAKFCKYCGKALQEGEICTCTAQEVTAPVEDVPQQSFQPEPAMQQAAEPVTFVQSEPQMQAPQQMAYQPNMQAPVTAPNPNVEAGKAYFSKLFDYMKKIFKAPVSAGAEFVRKCEHNLALGFMAIQAILIGLLVASYSGKINGIIEKMAILEEISLIEISAYTFPTVKIFFISAIAAFAIACLLPAVYMLFIKIFKGNTNYKYMLCISGINSLFNSPFILVGLIVGLLNPLNINLQNITNITSVLTSALVLPVSIASIGASLATFVSAFLLGSGSSLTKDKAPYVAFLSGIVMSIAILFVFRTVFPMCLPETIKIALDQAMAAQGFLESLF